MNINIIEREVPSCLSKTTIIPLEIHYSNRTRSNGFCKKTWLKAVNRIEKDPNCLVILVGDMIDADRPSSRAMKAHMYAEPERLPALEEEDLDHQRGLREGILKDLSRIKGKIIGMVDGDHYKLYANGLTSTWYIANQLGIPKAYLGQRMGYVKINFKFKKSTTSYHILIRHGKGGGNIGGDVNKLISQNIGFIADLYIGGHTHKQWFYKIPHIYPGAYDLKEKLVGYARAGSLLRGFIYGHTTYAETCEYNPLSIGWPEIYIYTTRTGPDNDRTLHVSDIKGLS